MYRNDQIDAQMVVLNQDYSNTGLSFVLANINRINNSSWFNIVGPNDDLQIDMKTQLRQGGAADLNLYSVGFKSGLLGYSTYPFNYESNSVNDGVVFLFSTVPGGGYENFNGGRVSRHLPIHQRHMKCLNVLIDANTRSRTLGRVIPYFRWRKLGTTSAS